MIYDLKRHTRNTGKESYHYEKYQMQAVRQPEAADYVMC
jgi:hypothetical protein